MSKPKKAAEGDGEGDAPDGDGNGSAPKKEAANKKVKAEKKMGGGGGDDPISVLLAYAAATASEVPEFGGGLAAQRRVDASNGEKEGQKYRHDKTRNPHCSKFHLPHCK